MTGCQPDTPSDPSGSVPPFPVVLRGYERHLVDARLAELLEQLDTQRRRADQAEQALSKLQVDIKAGRQLPDWFANLGAEVRQVGEQAALTAEQLLAEAGTRAQTAIDGAEAEATSRRKAAEEQARNLAQTAQATLAEAQADQAAAPAMPSAAEDQAETDSQQQVAAGQAEPPAPMTAAEEEADGQGAWEVGPTRPNDLPPPPPRPQ